MALLITIAVLAAIGGTVALIALSGVDVEIGPDEDHPADHPLFDDMRLARMRDAADDLIPQSRKPEGGQ